MSSEEAVIGVYPELPFLECAVATLRDQRASDKPETVTLKSTEWHSGMEHRGPGLSKLPVVLVGYHS